MSDAPSLHDVHLTGPSVVMVGTFDGVHRGHQRLLHAVREQAGSAGARAVVVTFDPPPREFLHPELERACLTALDERVRLLHDYGADAVVIAPFDAELAGWSAEHFIDVLIERLGMVGLVGGPDLTVGAGRAGTVAVLRALGQRRGFAVTVVGELDDAGQPVRSGQVRACLRAGDIERATRLLGRPYRLSGDVIEGDRRGRTIGVPTANLAIPPERLVPANGVYATWACLGTQRRKSVLNIGTRPTVDGRNRTVEVHLLDFAADIYGQRLTVELIDRLRDEQRFGSLDELVGQIRRDIARADRLLEARA